MLVWEVTVKLTGVKCYRTGSNKNARNICQFILLFTYSFSNMMPKNLTPLTILCTTYKYNDLGRYTQFIMQ